MEQEQSLVNTARTVQLIKPWFPLMPKRKRVAAYARVSLDTDNMRHSLAAQVSYYNTYIQSNPEWVFAGVYADCNESGARAYRPEFQHLLEDCRLGKIDIIITKSVSRFARNTALLLQTIRELKESGIDVYFEDQNIHSLSAPGELVLTFIACYAQAELVSVSENIKWRKRQDMRLGTTKPAKIYGYRVSEGTLVVCTEEAIIVKQVFSWYLSGLGAIAITNRLYEMGIASPTGMPRWNSTSVFTLLHSEKMRGNLLHQCKYTIDPISKKQVPNHGELPKYLVRNTHEGIVDDVTFDRVQEEASRRHRIGGLNEYTGLAFRRKIVCGYCGRHFIHCRAGNKQKVYPVWHCDGRDKRNRVSDICKARDVPEKILIKVTCEVLNTSGFDPDEFERRVKEIHVPAHHVLNFIMTDGSKITKTWEPDLQGIKEKGLPEQDSLSPLPTPSVIPAVGSKMTEGEKRRITELRSLGYEYRRIAASLGRPVNTIRTYCIYRPKWIAEGTLKEPLPPLSGPATIPARRSRLTDEEKARISELRALGYGYVRIAHSLGRPVGTIRHAVTAGTAYLHLVSSAATAEGFMGRRSGIPPANTAARFGSVTPSLRETIGVLDSAQFVED